MPILKRRLGLNPFDRQAQAVHRQAHPGICGGALGPEAHDIDPEYGGERQNDHQARRHAGPDDSRRGGLPNLAFVRLLCPIDLGNFRAFGFGKVC